ncbi:helix-turn-helix transcriptional regulator [Enterovibrio norvegicus]|uniref:helix-turn-helix transcriptional regulator n=1 Tax=Enterovibrio norvegicus TaxID=188144 RepID=UPI00036666B5|nr:AlpA family transcriptional regulator [Enterovibrio norvegicus]
MQKQPIKMIRLKEVIAITGLSRSSIYSYINDKRFPEQVSLGYRSVAWVESEIHDWLEQKVSERRH